MPPLVIALIIVNIFVMFAIWSFSSVHNVFLQFGFIPARPRLLTSFTSMFIHAGFWHIAGNMWFLGMFGRRIEHRMGSWLFALIYILSGLGGSLLHYAFNSGSAMPLGGASGAISGLIGCFFILYPKARFELVFYVLYWRVKTIQSTAQVAAGAWIVEQLLLALISQGFQFSSTAFWAHVGGFSVGVAAGCFYKPFAIAPPPPPRPHPSTAVLFPRPMHDEPQPKSLAHETPPRPPSQQ